MSLRDLLRRRQDRTFQNRMTEQSLPLGLDMPLDTAELEPAPLESEQLQLLAELLQGVTPDTPTRMPPSQSRTRAAVLAPPSLDLTDFERELVGQQQIRNRTQGRFAGMRKLPEVSAPVGQRMYQNMPSSAGRLDSQYMRLAGQPDQSILDAMSGMSPGEKAQLQRLGQAGNRLGEIGTEITGAMLGEYLAPEIPLTALGRMVPAPVREAMGNAGSAALGKLDDLTTPARDALGRLAQSIPLRPHMRALEAFRRRAEQLDLPLVPSAVNQPSTRTKRAVLEPPVRKVAPKASASKKAPVSKSKPPVDEPDVPVVTEKLFAKKPPSPAELKADAMAKKAKDQGLANIKAAAERALKRANEPPPRNETIAEFLARGGKIEKVPMGRSGNPVTAPPVSQGASEADNIRRSINFALSQRDANRRGAQKMRGGIAPIIAAILGGQSFQD